MLSPSSLRWSRFPAGLAIGVVLASMLVAACGSDKESATSTSSTTTTTVTDDGTSTTTTAGSPDAVLEAWNRDAVEHRGQNGERFTYDCPAGGTITSIWGVETYTDDSSVCTAAVHVGLITVAEGGEVEIEISAGMESYDAATANDVTSTYYNSWDGSFTFPAAPPGSGEFTVGPESWSRTAADRVGQDGTRLTIKCSPNGPFGGVWGTGTYTSDSSICTAAVHAGILDAATGGSVTVEIAAGQDSYEGSEANGVTSSDYGAYTGSFTFPADQS
jgi:hypothetical protein